MTGDMKTLDMHKTLCEICGKYIAITCCNGCGKKLCKKCRSMEIWPAEAGEITVKIFCPHCKLDPGCNPRGSHQKVFGLMDVTDMVNQGRKDTNRFKIKLKIP